MKIDETIHKTKVVEDTPSKKQQYTRSERMKETMKRRRSRIDSNRTGNGISVVAESPERKTRYYSGIPDLSVTSESSFNDSSLFKRALSGKTNDKSANFGAMFFGGLSAIGTSLKFQFF